MANNTTFIQANGKAEAVQGVKASYDPKSKTYTTKATLKVAAKWYKASYKKNGEASREERVVFTSRKNLAMVCTRIGKKIKFAPVPVSKRESYDAESLEALEKIARNGFEELKKYMNAKFNLKDMNWDTMLKKIGAIAEVVEESKEEEPKAEEVAA